MKKIIITLIIIALGISELHAQSAACMGLKNPTSFTFTGGTANSSWSGATGTKLSQASTCTTLGATLTTTVSAENLANIQSSSSCYNDATAYQPHRRFIIMSEGTDPVTGNNLHYTPPQDTSFHKSIRLGNYCGGTEEEAIYYEFDVNANNCLITIWYAVSLENALHDANYNPEFVITVEKQVGNSWQLAMGDTLCYIQPAPTSSSNPAPFTITGSNCWLNWNKVIINLEKLTFQRVRIRCATGDCGYTQHYGCCYIAGECAPMRLNANGCAAGSTSSVARIAAPKGAQHYRWYRSRTGVLSGTSRTDTTNYVFISQGPNDSVFNVELEHFTDMNTGAELTQTTFMCKMSTRMNPNYAIISPIFTDVTNKKPRIFFDTMPACDASITLRDISYTPYVELDADQVDTNNTRWYFYNTPNGNPSPLALLDSAVGGTVSYQFNNPGIYTVSIRTTAYDTSCWNEKSFTIRTIKAPTPVIRLERNNLCKGDQITMFNETLGGAFNEWTIHRPQGDTVIVTPVPACPFIFDTTCRVTLRTRNNSFFLKDTNLDGELDRVYCFTTIDTTIFVQNQPKLTVTGDTIVCNGDHSNVRVSADIENTRFDWYSILDGGLPLVENSNMLATTLTQDRTYYVKGTTPFGCVSWDSVNLYLVKPTLNTTTDKICEGDSVTLWAGKAATYEWTSSPYDPSFAGQEGNDTIHVHPTQTTTYSVVGHGSNGCGATALTQKVTVYPYPIQHIQVTPDYIDSENPSVQFADLSEYGTTSLWDFGNGNTSTVRTVVFTFTDLSQDSILISLTTANPLGCSEDTSFWIPVGIFAVWFPNAITPKLETNNIFKAFTANSLEDYELYIFDRSGNMIFQTEDVQEGWDGTYKGHDCKAGSYVYIAKYRREGGERVLSQKGTITLLR